MIKEQLVLITVIGLLIYLLDRARIKLKERAINRGAEYIDSLYEYFSIDQLSVLVTHSTEVYSKNFLIGMRLQLERLKDNQAIVQSRLDRVFGSRRLPYIKQPKS